MSKDSNGGREPLWKHSVYCAYRDGENCTCKESEDTFLRRPQLILSLCDYSGVWSQPYVDDGYDVLRIDLKRGQDVRLLELPDRAVQGVLAAPPCTVFANSGARWERSEREMLDGLSIVDACCRIILATRPRWWVLENPAGKLSRYLGPPAMTFQPNEYGDPYTKLTCLWGVFRAPIRELVEATQGSMHGSAVAGVPGFSAGEAGCAQALIFMAADPDTEVVLFDTKYESFPLTPKMRLDTVYRQWATRCGGGTDCSLPMQYAIDHARDVDAIITLTDAQTWHGQSHPAQELKRYRERFGQTRHVEVAMVANRWSTSDESDADSMRVVGFDAAVPNLVSGFIKGDF